MILNILTWAPYVVGGAAMGVLIARTAHLAYRIWRDHQRDIGHAYGTLDGLRIGDRKGYSRGYSQACLDHVLATPDEAQYYARIVAQIPDAQDLADAHRLGAIRRSVQGQEEWS